MLAMGPELRSPFRQIPITSRDFLLLPMNSEFHGPKLSPETVQSVWEACDTLIGGAGSVPKLTLKGNWIFRLVRGECGY